MILVMSLIVGSEDVNSSERDNFVQKPKEENHSFIQSISTARRYDNSNDNEFIELNNDEFKEALESNRSKKYNFPYQIIRNVDLNGNKTNKEEYLNIGVKNDKKSK